MTVVQARPPVTLGDPRIERRARLIAEAEVAVAARGLAGLRARELAVATGCSVGAIYNLVADLDELALLVGQRTMADLDATIVAAVTEDGRADDDAEIFIGWALAYAAFAAANRERWRALFEFKSPAGRPLPEWFAVDQIRLFGRLEARLARLRPDHDEERVRIGARTLFSAVHGIVLLGLEGKLVSVPPEALESELTTFVATYIGGLVAARPA